MENIENQMFLEITPSFESVLFWKDKKDRAGDICEMIERFNFIYNDDPDAFYEHNYDFCMRSISLLDYYQDDSAFEHVFQLYKNLSLDGDEVLTGTCESYLKNQVKEKHQDLLKSQFMALYELYGKEEFVVFWALRMLVMAEFYSEDVESIIIEMLWGDDFTPKSIISPYLKNYPRAVKELEKRLRYIAPMVKYGEKHRFENPYVEDWIELSEPYLDLCKGISLDKDYANGGVDRSEDDEFLLQCLGTSDERVAKINKKYINENFDEEYFQKAMEVSNKREKIMSGIFLDALPDTAQEWLSSPFVNQDQKNELFHYLESIAPKKEVTQKRVKIGRNDPCSCGSGKKYKKCCLN